MLKLRYSLLIICISVLSVSMACNTLEPETNSADTSLVITSTPTATYPPQPTATVTPTATPVEDSSAEGSGYQLPHAHPTPESLRVEPVTSPTDELSQDVVVCVGHAEAITVTTESGAFSPSGYGNICSTVEVQLLPNIMHHVKVEVKIVSEQTEYMEASSYRLTTTRDTSGMPLVIQQGQSISILPAEVILPENIDRLQQLVTFSPDARLVTDFTLAGNTNLISVGYDDSISIWDLTTGKETQQIGEGYSEALIVAVNSDQSIIATGGTAADPSVCLWDTISGEARVIGHSESTPVGLSFSPDETLLAFGDNGNLIQIWDIETGQTVLRFEGDVPKLHQRFTGLFWTDDDTLIAVGATVVYWLDLKSGQVLKRAPVPDEVALAVDAAYSTISDQLAIVCQDDAVYVWDLERNDWEAWTAPGDSYLTNVQFSPDGKILVASSKSVGLIVWDVDSHTILKQVPSMNDVTAIRFSIDGRYLATGGWSSPIRVWGIP